MLSRRGTVRALLVAAATALAAASATAEPRTLFIALDAVPYSLLAELTDPARGDEALFRGFKGPVPLVSSFPSTTSVAMGGMLEPFGLERSPGYEARFFDWRRRRVRGGGPVSYFRIAFAWRTFFDWNRRGPVGSALEALRPIRASVKRLDRAIHEFLESDRQTYFIYIAATDTAGHLLGPPALAEVFEGLDEILVEARRDYPDEPFRAVIFSDHGLAGEGPPLRNVWKPLRKALRRNGLRYRQRLRGPGDVVLTPFGLVSSFEAYTLEESKRETAAVLAGVKGVDLCVLRSGEAWAVISSRGSARFGRDEGPDGGLWWYDHASGDPLGFAPLVESFRRRAGAREDRFPDAWWLEATMETDYPDALYRLARAFDLVENPASVLCSVAEGFMYGAPRTERLARLGGGRLRWTHGALSRGATLGFLMSDVEAWHPPAAARFDRSLQPFAGGTEP